MSKRVVGVADLNFPFRGQPYAKVGRTREECDPAPAYQHDLKLVGSTLRSVEGAFKVKHVPTIYVLSHEGLSRTNGWADRSWNYDDESDERSWEGVVCLSGKRIPPHPAVTRYVVAHEYGHHVEWEILRRRGVTGYDADEGLRSEYANLRGISPEKFYGCGTWHASIGELIANDFRILVADNETDYWPHPGFKRPEKVAGLTKWWTEALA